MSFQVSEADSILGSGSNASGSLKPFQSFQPVPQIELALHLSCWGMDAGKSPTVSRRHFHFFGPQESLAALVLHVMDFHSPHLLSSKRN